MVLGLDEQDWRPSALSTSDPGWDEQGSLHSLAGRLYSVRFDQRSAPTGLRTRLTVFDEDPTGESRQLGPKLIDNELLVGPLYWGLTYAKAELLAMATVPNPIEGRNELKVYRLAER